MCYRNQYSIVLQRLERDKARSHIYIMILMICAYKIDVVENFCGHSVEYSTDSEIGHIHSRRVRSAENLISAELQRANGNNGNSNNNNDNNYNINNQRTQQMPWNQQEEQHLIDEDPSFSKQVKDQISSSRSDGRASPELKQLDCQRSGSTKADGSCPMKTIYRASSLPTRMSRSWSS